MDIRTTEQQYNPYRIFTREQWARLRDDTPMTLEPGEFERLRYARASLAASRREVSALTRAAARFRPRRSAEAAS